MLDRMARGVKLGNEAGAAGLAERRWLGGVTERVLQDAGEALQCGRGAAGAVGPG
jgi:hypothetical protein